MMCYSSNKNRLIHEEDNSSLNFINLLSIITLPDVNGSFPHCFFSLYHTKRFIFFPYVGHHTVCVCGHHQCYLLFQLLLVIYLPCILRCSKTELDSCLDVLCKANKFDDLHL